jgi:hypothetical protein
MSNKYLILILCFIFFIGLDFSCVHFLVIEEIKIADVFILNFFIVGVNFLFFHFI